MRIAALMPTYRRRRLVENALACFLAQSHADKRLLIGDDSGELAPQQGDHWEVAQLPRQPSLPAKYNLMARIAIEKWSPDALAVFEDDDVYFADYLANHVAALQTTPDGWSHCSWVWTDGSGGGPPGPLRPEPTGHARLHGCLALSRSIFDRLGGWPDTRRMDFDLQMLSRLRADRPPCDPCQFGSSQYYFRWASTHMPHGQAYCTGPADENWLAKAQTAIDSHHKTATSTIIVPQMDAESLAIRQFAGQHTATHFAPEFHVRNHSRQFYRGVSFATVLASQVLITPPRMISRMPFVSAGVPSPSIATLSADVNNEHDEFLATVME